MKRKLLTVLLLATPFLVHAQAPVAVDGACLAKMAPGGHERPGPAGKPPLPPFLHGINLSEQQQDRLFELTHQQMPALRKLGKDTAQALDKLHELALSGRYDEGEARRLARQAADAQSAMALALRQQQFLTASLPLNSVAVTQELLPA